MAHEMFKKEPTGSLLRISRLQAKLSKRLLNPTTGKLFNGLTIAGYLRSTKFSQEGGNWCYANRGLTFSANQEHRAAFAKASLRKPPTGGTAAEFWGKRVIGIDFASSLVPQTEYKLEGLRLAHLGKKKEGEIPWAGTNRKI